MIEQQYYTRERGGLFTQTDGYDTVAKTPLIKLDFIKKNLHPICSYDIPSELQKSGETDESKYPPNFMIFPTSTGEMIVGQAIYKNKDFTGLRSTFFMHNFVLSDNEKRRYVKEPEKLFGITGFATCYNESDGRELPTLAGIPYEGEKPYFKDREKLFSKLGMDNTLFHKLIYATFIAATSKKKIYIVLNVPIEELGELSKALLYHLYQELPWSITEKLGICTYSGKLEAKKSIQITFLDQNTLRYDNKMGKEFIFDFVNKKFLNVEGDVEAETYIKIAHYYTHNKLAWEKFNKWVEELSITLKNKSDKNITYYGRIATLFEMSLYLKSGRGYDLSDQKVRKGLMSQILKDLQSNISDEMKEELTQILEYTIMLLHQGILQNGLFTKDEIKVLLQFKLKVCAGVLEQEAHCIQILINLLEAAANEGNMSYIEMIFEAVKAYSVTYVHLYQALYERPQLKEKVAYPVIEARLKEVTVIDELIRKMGELEILEPILLSDSYYRQRIYSCFDRCLSSAANEVKLLLQVQKWCQEHKGSLYDELQEACESYFIEHINLKDIDSESTLCKLKFRHAYPEENYEVIMAYQKLRTELSFMSPNKIRVNAKVQELIKMYYKQNVRKDDFYMLVYAFLEPGQEVYSYGPKLNLKRVLGYLYSISAEMMLDFIIWSKGQEVYIEKNTFDHQVITFFTTLKQKEGKIPKGAIKEKLGSKEKTKALCEMILKAQKPAFLKFLRAHQKGMGVSFGLLVIGIGIGTGGYYYYQSNNAQKVKENFERQDIDFEAIQKLMPNITLQKESVETYIQENLIKDEIESQKEQETNDKVSAEETNQLGESSNP